MTILRIFIDDTVHKKYQWLLFDHSYRFLKGDYDTLNTMPISDEIEIVVPTEWVSFTSTNLPIGNRKKVLEALPYLIEDHLITPPEQAHVVIAESQLNNQVVLASIDNQILESLLKLLDTQGIRANKLYPASTLINTEVDSWAMVFEDSEFFLCTSPSNGIALTSEEDNSLPIEFKLALKAAQSTQITPSKIIVYGKNNIRLDDWSAELNIPFVISTTEWKKLRYQSTMNFLQGKFAPPNKTWEVISNAKPAFVLLLATMGISLIGTSIDWAHKAFERNKLDTQMKALFLATFPDSTNVVNAHLQMQRKLSDLKHASGEYEEHDFLPWLANVSKATGGLTNLTAIDYKENQLTLTIQANNEQDARDLSQKINSSGLPNSIENITSNAGIVSFDMVFKAGGKE